MFEYDYDEETIYDVAMLALTKVLRKEGIPFHVIPIFEDGWKIQFGIESGSPDVVCHRYSSGGRYGYWESMGFPSDEGDVTGCLTEKAVIDKCRELV